MALKAIWSDEGHGVRVRIVDVHGLHFVEVYDGKDGCGIERWLPFDRAGEKRGPAALVLADDVVTRMVERGKARAS